MQNEQKRIFVIKLGGSIFEKKDTSIRDIVNLQREGYQIVVIHGGAHIVSDWLKELDIPTTFVQGERITDERTLEVVTAILAGLVNKEIVAAIIHAGGQAVGISGVDGGLIQGRQRHAHSGYMGNVVKVNPNVLWTLLNSAIIPVVAPISLHAFNRPEDARSLLNINGDPAAGEIARSLGAEKLIFLTDVPGIIGANGELIKSLTPKKVNYLLESGIASGGMVPKLSACLRALEGGSVACIMDGREPHAILKELANGNCGTQISEEIPLDD
jgi:acetylglutamate kinase